MPEPLVSLAHARYTAPVRARRSYWACVLPETNSNARLLQPSQSSLQPRTFSPRRNYCPGRVPFFVVQFTRARRLSRSLVPATSVSPVDLFDDNASRRDERRRVSRVVTGLPSADKSSAARLQGTDVVHAVRWRRGAVALLNQPQERKGGHPHHRPAPLPAPATRTRCAVSGIGSIGDFNGLIGKKGCIRLPAAGTRPTSLPIGRSRRLQCMYIRDLLLVSK